MIKQIQWFDESPDQGSPECICSLCGKPLAELTIRLFDETSEQEARFDKICFDLVMGRPELPEIYTMYLQPFGSPFHWRDEASGRLPTAVAAFINYMADKSDPLPSPEQVAMVIQYCTYFIFGPCWDINSFSLRELLQLRYEIQFVQTIQQFDDWLRRAIKISLDPL